MNCDQTIDNTESAAQTLHGGSVNMFDDWIEKIIQPIRDGLLVGTSDWFESDDQPVFSDDSVYMDDDTVVLPVVVTDDFVYTREYDWVKSVPRVVDRKEVEPMVPIGDTD